MLKSLSTFSPIHFVLLLLHLAPVSLATALNARDVKALVKRQFIPSNLPAACQPACAAITSTLQTCTALDCLCTNSTAQQIAQCADCLAGVSGSGSTTSTQQIVDEYNGACATSGSPITSVIVTPIPPTGVASSGSGIQTGSGSTQTSPSPSNSSSHSGATSWSSSRYILRTVSGTCLLIGISFLSTLYLW